MVKFSTPQKYEFMFKSVLIAVSATFLNVADVLICIVLAAFYSLFCVFLLIIWFFIYFSCRLVIFYSYMILTVVYACWLFLYVKNILCGSHVFLPFPVIACSVYAVLCNMKYVGMHVFQLPFLSKNRMPFMLLRLPLSGSCPCLRGCVFTFCSCLFLHAIMTTLYFEWQNSMVFA